ncbi:MAG: phage holin family protein [Eubacteriales bacterium]|nr:phage holin family protein [Eubacteriales bacterium]MDD3883185.1 phage holin family protein [Eubacteriales bacterium]MDD4513344.1 phage holin family protein [Eubacteriales bacterium]
MANEMLRDGWDIIAQGGMALVGGFGGRMPMAMPLLLTAMACDLAAGICLGLRGKSPRSKNGYLSAKACFSGLLQKAVVLLVVFLAATLDGMLGGDAPMFAQASALFYLSHELISLFENLSRMGVPMPSRLRRALGAFREAE